MRRLLWPQYLQPTSDQETANLVGEVIMTERPGTDTIIDMELPDGNRIVSQLGEARVFEPGTKVGLAFTGDRAHLFFGT